MRTDTADLQATERQPVRFTPEEFYLIGDQGMLPEMCELVDGEIIEMPGQNFLAVFVIGRIYRALIQAWSNPDAVATHLSQPFTSGWHPLPDVVLYDELPPFHPRLAPFPMPRLVVEVSRLDAEVRPRREGDALRGGRH